MNTEQVCMGRKAISRNPQSLWILMIINQRQRCQKDFWRHLTKSEAHTKELYILFSLMVPKSNNASMLQTGKLRLRRTRGLESKLKPRPDFKAIGSPSS